MKKFYLSSLAIFIVLLLSGSALAQSNSSENAAAKSEDEKVYKQSEVDRKAEVTKRYFPKTDRMCNQLEGTAKVLVTLHKSGKVSDVKLTASSDCQRFDENSLESSRKIKFNPAIKDGQPVSVTVVVLYEFRAY